MKKNPNIKEIYRLAFLEFKLLWSFISTMARIFNPRSMIIYVIVLFISTSVFVEFPKISLEKLYFL